MAYYAFVPILHLIILIVGAASSLYKKNWPLFGVFSLFLAPMLYSPFFSRYLARRIEEEGRAALDSLQYINTLTRLLELAAVVILLHMAWKKTKSGERA